MEFSANGKESNINDDVFIGDKLEFSVYKIRTFNINIRFEVK